MRGYSVGVSCSIPHAGTFAKGCLILRSSELQRGIDRFVGIPVAMLVGLATRHRNIPADPRRIGVVQPSAIGDLILASGMIARLHVRYPAAEIHLFHGPSNAGATTLLETEVISHRCHFANPFAVLAELRRARLDILIDLTPWPRSTALLCRFSNSACTIGFDAMGQHRGPLFDVAVAHSTSVHAVENFRNLADLFLARPDYRFALRATFPEPDIALAYDRLILLHLWPGGSRAAAKRWPKARWIELARILLRDGYDLAFTGVEGDRADVQAIIDAIGSEPDRCRSLCGQLALDTLAHVVKRARLIVTVDTATAHLAAALDRPVVGLYGPSASRSWGARGARAVNVDSPHPAAGYIYFGYEHHPAAMAIMAAITVASVYEAVRTALGRDGDPAADSFAAGDRYDLAAREPVELRAQPVERFGDFRC
jgi:ADP-heptose:LPS heptosyltransferase